MESLEWDSDRLEHVELVSYDEVEAKIRFMAKFRSNSQPLQYWDPSHTREIWIGGFKMM